jgi:hypothetical protein
MAAPDASRHRNHARPAPQARSLSHAQVRSDRLLRERLYTWSAILISLATILANMAMLVR